MSDLLTELGKKLTDRWLTTLLLPGLLYTTAALYGYLTGHHHALDPTYLTTQLTHHTQTLNHHPVAITVTITLILLSATTASLTAQTLATLIHRAFTAKAPRRWLLHRRRTARTRLTHQHPRPPARYLPARATPIGDHFHLTGQRIDTEYGLDTTLTWPRLWLLLPETTRSIITTATSDYRTATTTTAWGLLYLTLGILWWPATLAGTLTLTLGYRHAHTTSTTLANLIEATIDTHQHTLADALGIPLPHHRITPTEGARINDILNKRA